MGTSTDSFRGHVWLQSQLLRTVEWTSGGPLFSLPLSPMGLNGMHLRAPLSHHTPAELSQARHPSCKLFPGLETCTRGGSRMAHETHMRVWREGSAAQRMQRNQVWFPVPTPKGSQPSVIPALGDLPPSSGLYGICTQMHISTHRHIHTHLKHNNSFNKVPRPLGFW